MRRSIFFSGRTLLSGFLVLGDEITDKTLDPVMKMELIRLDELWNVLDQCAAPVWPGWTGTPMSLFSLTM